MGKYSPTGEEILNEKRKRYIKAAKSAFSVMGWKSPAAHRPKRMPRLQSQKDPEPLIFAFTRLVRQIVKPEPVWNLALEKIWITLINPQYRQSIR